MAVRNCSEIGENLQRVLARLMANDDLVKLLYYTDKNPLAGTTLTTQQKQDLIYNKLIRVVPKVGETETAQSIVVIRVDSGTQLSDNDQFKEVIVSFEVFVPLTQWMIQNSNLRPFAILGEIQKSINGKTINGLGKMVGGDFILNILTEEMSAYEAHYSIISYD